MSVEGVKNNSSNCGWYTAGGILTGAGAGAATAYLTNPFMKNGEPVDEFVRTVIVNNQEGSVKELLEIDEGVEFLQKLEKTKDADKLKKLCEVYLKKAPDKVISDSEKQLIREQLNTINSNNFESVKGEIFNILDNADEQIAEFKQDIKSYWNESTKKFEGKGAFFDTIKDSLSGLKLKNAFKYSALGAFITGISTYLFLKNKNS